MQEKAEKAGGDSSDLLPGICALAHEVLVDVTLPEFRCCSGVRAPLTHWFDNCHVAMQLQVRYSHLPLTAIPQQYPRQCRLCQS